MFSSTDGMSDDIMSNSATTNGPAPIAVYLYAGDQIIENVTTGTLYFQDSLGNTSHVTNAAGNLLESYTYSAFGQPSFFNSTSQPLNSSTYNIRHLFQGQLWTQETGLNDYRNRVELPAMGVFLQPDPIGFKGDASNVYRFCNNNAVNRTDPMGLLDRNWDAVRQAMDACNLIGFFQAEADANAQAASATALPSADAAYKPIHVVNEGNGGDRNAPDYYQKGPLVGKDGKPNDNQGQTIAETRGYDKNPDGSVTARVFIDVHVLTVHKGDSVDDREQEHPNGFKTVADDAFLKTMKNIRNYHSTSEIQDAKIQNFQKAFDFERLRQQGWHFGGGRHDYSKFREWGLSLNFGSP